MNLHETITTTLDRLDFPTNCITVSIKVQIGVSMCWISNIFKCQINIKANNLEKNFQIKMSITISSSDILFSFPACLEVSIAILRNGCKVKGEVDRRDKEERTLGLK